MPVRRSHAPSNNRHFVKPVSAGILLYRHSSAGLEVLLAHPGGPYWKDRDLGHWGIPKGRVDPGEELFAAARREFLEETGVDAGPLGTPLTPRRQPGGKTIHAWAIEGDCDAAACRSNHFSMEWPPRSGRTERFPEIDRAEWFGLEHARAKILPGQAPFLDELAALLERRSATG